MDQINISEKQRPVINRLSHLLDQSQSVAAAISDNAIEDSDPLPRELLQSFVNDLYKIKASLESAFEIHAVDNL